MHISAVGPPVLRETLGRGLEETRSLHMSQLSSSAGVGVVSALRIWQVIKEATQLYFASVDFFPPPHSALTTSVPRTLWDGE